MPPADRLGLYACLHNVQARRQHIRDHRFLQQLQSLHMVLKQHVKESSLQGWPAAPAAAAAITGCAWGAWAPVITPLKLKP